MNIDEMIEFKFTKYSCDPAEVQPELVLINGI